MFCNIEAMFLNFLHHSPLFASMTRCCIFSCVRPFNEWAESDLDRSMHISLWV